MGTKKGGWRQASLVVLLLLTTMLIAAACATPAPAEPAGDAVQTSDAGQVKVMATRQVGAAVPTFAVALDTHTAELDGYDLRQLALLRTDQGKEARPSGWDAPTGGHHRSGTLTFPSAASDGSPLIGPATRELVLVIREVGGVAERELRWAL